MIQQDSTDETGVSLAVDTGDRNSLRIARERKADSAIALKLAGADWQEIARFCGYPTPRAAQVATEKALQKQLAEESSREQMRRLADARLNRLIRALWAKAIDENHPEQLNAVNRVRELIADHRKLFGLDAPTEVLVTNPSTSQIEAFVARLITVGMPDVEESDIIDGEWQEDERLAIQA